MTQAESIVKIINCYYSTHLGIYQTSCTSPCLDIHLKWRLTALLGPIHTHKLNLAPLAAHRTTGGEDIRSVRKLSKIHRISLFSDTTRLDIIYAQACLRACHALKFGTGNVQRLSFLFIPLSALANQILNVCSAISQNTVNFVFAKMAIL